MKPLPLILTLTIDPLSHDLFTSLRTKYFPKYCNYLEAHLTLFHRLPPDIAEIEEVLKGICKREPLHLEVTGIKNMGNGVAYTISSAELMAMHKEMQKEFGPWLISRDRHILWPHITIQNKVTAYKALQTTAFLKENFQPFGITATGIESWYYRGGSWERGRRFEFGRV